MLQRNRAAASGLTDLPGSQAREHCREGGRQAQPGHVQASPRNVPAPSPGHITGCWYELSPIKSRCGSQLPRRALGRYRSGWWSTQRIGEVLARMKAFWH